MRKPTLDEIETRMAGLGCGDAVAGLHKLVGVSPASSLFPYARPERRDLDPGPCEELLAPLDAALRKSPRLVRALVLRGRLLRALGRGVEAAAALDKALAAAPADPAALAWRAELLLHLEGPSAGSAAAMSEAAAAAPGSPWPSVWTAAALLPAGAGPEVFALLDAALGVAPQNVPALLLRAIAHERCARFEAGRADAAEAARLAPACVGILALRGRLEARLGRADEAAATFASAARLEPGAKEYYAALVTADQPPGKEVFGLDQLDAYLKKRPDAAWAYALRGDMRRTLYDRYEPGADERKRRDNVGAGLADLLRAVELSPRTPWMRACLARTQTASLKSEDGIASLREAIAQDPECGWLYSWLAECHRQFGRHEEAVPLFRRALELSPRFAQAHVWLGRVHGERERWSLAVEEFSRAVRVDCDYGFAYAKRGQALARLGRHADALLDYDRALALGTYPAWTGKLRSESAASVKAPR
jgi:tetratricopeptide (TPR) repeat protein